MLIDEIETCNGYTCYSILDISFWKPGDLVVYSDGQNRDTVLVVEEPSMKKRSYPVDSSSVWNACVTQGAFEQTIKQTLGSSFISDHPRLMEKDNPWVEFYDWVVIRAD